MLADGKQVQPRVQIIAQVHSDEAGPMSSQEFKSVGKGLDLDQQDTWLDMGIATLELQHSTGRDQRQDPLFKGKCQKEE